MIRMTTTMAATIAAVMALGSPAQAIDTDRFSLQVSGGAEVFGLVNLPDDASEIIGDIFVGFGGDGGVYYSITPTTRFGVGLTGFVPVASAAEQIPASVGMGESETDLSYYAAFAEMEQDIGRLSLSLGGEYGRMNGSTEFTDPSIPTINVDNEGAWAVRAGTGFAINDRFSIAGKFRYGQTTGESNLDFASGRLEAKLKF